MPINELWLKDVGPIDEITFTFDPQVNVFIGPNNSGKSTVLAALAALTVQSFEFPPRFVHNGSQPASLVTYTGLQGLVGTFEGSPNDWGTRDRVLDRMTMRMGLGYSAYVPALRQNSNARISEHPITTKLLPLEANLVKFHMDQELKNTESRSDEMMASLRMSYSDMERRKDLNTPTFEVATDEDFLRLIVELDYRSYRENRPSIRKRINNVFTVSSEITEGFCVDFLSVDKDELGLFVKLKTPDGELPFNALSQGTQSMIQWLAHLILGYALYYDFAEDFAEKPGVLIIDEIDAHLHPSWQRRILPTLTKHFPNLQIFCATHSPLLIAGLKAGQIQLLRRKEGGGISVTTNENDIVGWSADEIFSCFLDIPNPTDLKTDQDLQRLEELQLKRERTPEEEKEREELRSEVPKALMNAPPPKQISELVESLHEILKERETSKETSKKAIRKHTRKSA